MTRRTIPGGSYVEAWPTGDYACLIARSHVETSAGNIAIPPGSGLGPIYTRLYVGAGLRLAGQDQVSGNAWLWDGLRWVDRGDSYGVSPCAFGPLDGFLYVAKAGWGGGSQGIRYVRTDGAIISGDDTYADPVEKIYQFTTQGDITIGQDHEDGVIVVYTGMRKRLASGNCQFVRFNRAGDRLAVAWWTPKENAAQLAWFHVSEIASLPDAPLVFDKPIEKPKPKPKPEPQPVSIPNYLDHVKKVGDQTGHRYTDDALTDEQRIDEAAKLTAKVASDIYHGRNGAIRDMRVGLYRKGNKYGFDENRLYFDLGNGTAAFAKIVIQTGAAHASLGWNETDHIFPSIDYAHQGGVGWFMPPLIGSDAPTQPGTGTPPSSDLAKQMAALSARMQKLEQQPAPAFPQRIALKTAHGRYVVAEPDGSLAADRDEAGAWETFTVEAK